MWDADDILPRATELWVAVKGAVKLQEAQCMRGPTEARVGETAAQQGVVAEVGDTAGWQQVKGKHPQGKQPLEIYMSTRRDAVDMADGSAGGSMCMVCLDGHLLHHLQTNGDVCWLHGCCKAVQQDM